MSRPSVWVGSTPVVGLYSEGYPVPTDTCQTEIHLDFAISPTFSRVEFHPHGQVIVWLIRPVFTLNKATDEYEFVEWVHDGSHSYMPHKSPWVHIRGVDGKKIGQFPVYYFPEFPDPPMLELRWPVVYYEIFHWLHFAIGAEETWNIQSLDDDKIHNVIAEFARSDPMVARIIEMRNITDEARRLGYNEWCDRIDAIVDIDERKRALHTLVDHILEKCTPQTIELKLGTPVVLVEPTVTKTVYTLPPLQIEVGPETKRLTYETGLRRFEQNLMRLQNSKRRPTHYLHDTAVRIVRTPGFRAVFDTRKKPHITYPIGNAAQPAHANRAAMISMLETWDQEHRYDIYQALFARNRPDNISLEVRFSAKNEQAAEQAIATLKTPGKFTQGIRKMFDMLNSGADDNSGATLILFTKVKKWGRCLDKTLKREMRLRGIVPAPAPSEDSHLGDNEPEKFDVKPAPVRNTIDSDDDSTIKSVASEETPVEPAYSNKPSKCFSSCYVLARGRSYRIIKVIAIPPPPEHTYTRDHIKLFLDMVMQMDGQSLMETDVDEVHTSEGEPVDGETARRYIANLHRVAIAKIYARWYNIPTTKDLADTFRHMDMMFEQMMLERQKVVAMNGIKHMTNGMERTRRARLIELVHQRRIIAVQTAFEARSYKDFLMELDRELELRKCDLKAKRAKPRGIDEKTHRRRHYEYKLEMAENIHGLKAEELNIRREMGEFTEKQYSVALIVMTAELEKLKKTIRADFYPNSMSRLERKKLESACKTKIAIDGNGNFMRIPKSV